VDTFRLIADERIRLADALIALDPDEWDAPSLCGGWSVHLVAAHLNVPWSVSLPEILLAVTRARSLDGGFDRIAHDVAARLDPAACIAGLREHADSTFTPPGSGPEAPLTDVLVHGADMLQPLGRSVEIAPDALETSLTWLARGRAKGFVPKGRVAGLVFESTDIDLQCGNGPSVVQGTALALCSSLCGRASMLERLSGDGVEVLRKRM
jgi:uncharacterized protein (TIGR03083 family)